MVRKIHSESDIIISFEIRRKVFIEEQNVPESEEYDQFEKKCKHYLIFENDSVVGTARIRKTEKGYKIERLAILFAYRKKGFGRELIKYLLTRLKKTVTSLIYLSAQVQAIEFYEKLGFYRKGETYFDANIEHIQMEFKKKIGK